VMIASYFCLCQLTFVPAWNRRVARLAKQRRWPKPALSAASARARATAVTKWGTLDS